MPFKVTHDMLTLDDVVAAVAERTGEETPAGAVTSFIGQVRGDNLGKRVIRLEYEDLVRVRDPVSVCIRVIFVNQDRRRRELSGLQHT